MNEQKAAPKIKTTPEQISEWKRELIHNAFTTHGVPSSYIYIKTAALIALMDDFTAQDAEIKRLREALEHPSAHTHCCFCGTYNPDDPKGYAGERSCHACGHGGQGEGNSPQMASEAWNNRPAALATPAPAEPEQCPDCHSTLKAFRGYRYDGHGEWRCENEWHAAPTPAPEQAQKEALP